MKLYPKPQTAAQGVEPRGPNILLIGWVGHPAESFYHWFKFHGCNVFWVGDHAADLDLQNIPSYPVNRYPGPMGLIDISERRMSLHSILDLLRDFRFDLIFHVQDWTRFTDYEKSPIPYVYYHTEPFYPHGVPQCAWEVVCPNTTMIEQTRSYFGNKYEYGLMPWCLRDDYRQIIVRNWARFAVNRRRQLPLSFAGAADGVSLYQFRLATLKYLVENLGSDFYCKVTGFRKNENRKGNVPTPMLEHNDGHEKLRLKAHAYLGMLSRSKFGLNIPTHYGTNFRDMEVPATGAILLTRDMPDLESMGFHDGENCAVYRTPEEAADIVRSGFDPNVAMRGQMNVLHNHTYAARIPSILDGFATKGYIPDTYTIPDLETATIGG